MTETNTTIYNLKLNENESTYFRIKDDGFLYGRNCCDGVLFKNEFRYLHLISIVSNEMLKKNRYLSPKEWNEEIDKHIAEFMDDIEELPKEWKDKAYDDMILFKYHFHKGMIKKTNAMNKMGITEYDIGQEGERFCLETGKKVCHTCGKYGKLLRCSRCCNISYCSTDCSRADWKRHKPNCLKKEKKYVSDITCKTCNFTLPTMTMEEHLDKNNIKNKCSCK